MADNEYIPKGEGSSAAAPLESGRSRLLSREVSSQVPFAGLCMTKPEEQTSRVKNLHIIEESSQVPFAGLCMTKPEEQTSRVKNLRIIEESPQVPTTNLDMIKPEEQKSRVKNLRIIEESSHVPTINLNMIKLEEQTSEVKNPTLVQNPMIQPMNLPASDSEGSTRVSSQWESLLKFRDGMTASSRQDEDIRPGKEPLLGGMEGVYQGIQHLMDRLPRLKAHNPPFVRYGMKELMNLPASDFDSSSHESSEMESLLEYCYGFNPSSRQDDDKHTANEPVLGAIGEVPQTSWGQMHRISVNEPSLSVDPNLRFEPSSSSRENFGTGLLTIGRYGNHSGSVSPVRYEDIIGKELLSNRRDRDFNLSEDPLDKRVIDVAKRLLSACNKQGENPDFTSSDILEEYLKLYQERSPENYDFSLNLMAHIEFLNDNSWTATVTYFDEDIKRMVTCIWNETHNILNEITLETYNRDMVLKLMKYFTELSVNENFKFETFFKYCVLMCQLGVIARKGIFKEASFYAICQLRERIKFLKCENLMQIMLDIIVKNYAKRQNKM